MSQRRTTVPPTRESSRSPRSGRSGLIAKEKTKKQSARKRTALDNRFHRTNVAAPRLVRAHDELSSPRAKILGSSNTEDSEDLFCASVVNRSSIRRFAPDPAL